MTPLIELCGISRSYRIGDTTLRVLESVDLVVQAGEFVAITGPSGSGKSTLMQILGLLDRPSAGRYLLDGRDVAALSDDEGASLRSREMGFVFQMFNLLSRTSALDNVALPMVYAGGRGRQERARRLLDEVGLGDRLDHHPNQLSGGQQQRVAIARALVNRPRVIFADEPTGNLSSAQAGEILDRLEALNREGITVIMVTHEPEIAARARRVIRVKDGTVVSDERQDGARYAALSEQAQAAAGPVLTDELVESLNSAARAIRANKARSALSILGILIGVASVIAMLALGRGAQKAVESQISGLGSNLITLMPARISFGGVQRSGGVSRLTFADLEAVGRAHPSILRVDASVSRSVQIAYRSNNASTEVTGATPLYEPMRSARPYYGRFFTAAENEANARVCLLGQTVVTALFGTENPIGKTIKLDRVDYTVVGILPMKGAAGPRDQDDAVLVPLNTAMKRIVGARYLGSIAIETDGPGAMDDVMEAVRALMRKRRGLPEHKEDDFDLRNMADLQAALSGTTKTFTALLGAVAAISMLVGGIGIMNIMLVSVSERTREIGLRKAIGATRRAVLSQFLIEAAALSMLGGALGIVTGSGISAALSHFAGWAAIVSPGSVMASFAFSAGVGVLFGLWPARKASLLSPIEALRYE